ncbi:MAG: glycosyltransferase family 2 protein [Leptolyngbyaceae cyanobacterium bins.349]|nr:glycosyltransferase family 2 protein [Leptolyngbyaceae cyanobacterium bins.349]
MRCHVSKPSIICLTPIKNEAWILDRFLKCASQWADHIIIADQGSIDNSKEIALAYSKVTLIENSSPIYDEVERQKLLIRAAREFPEPRLLIALDADEMLTANFMECPEWQTVLQAPKGTVIRFEWANLMPGIQSYWPAGYDHSLGFMDDGTEHTGKKIHSPRIPVPSGAPAISLKKIKVLHYQYSYWKRMESKHRWYQCWERINYPERSPIDVYRQYHHMYAIPENKIRSLPPEWIDGYERQGIDMTSNYEESVFWWDKEVVDWLKKYGSDKFRREAIWDLDWKNLLGDVYRESFASNLDDPRNKFDRFIHKRWLPKTQARAEKFHIRLVDIFLKLIWR